MDVKLVQAGVVAITRELDLELYLIAFHPSLAHRTRRANAGATPRPIRATTWKLAVANGFTSLLAENLLVHLAPP